MPFKKYVEAVERAKKVKLVIFDVHGVLTDNTVLYNEEGIRSRIFAMKTFRVQRPHVLRD